MCASVRVCTSVCLCSCVVCGMYIHVCVYGVRVVVCAHVLAEGESSKLTLWIHTSISAPVTSIMYALNLLKVYHKGIIVQ